MGTALAENLATEFLRLLEEGWTPDIDEFLSRVPEQQREHCRQRIEEVAVLNGVTIAAGLSQSEPSSPEELAREIVPPAKVEPDEPVEVGTEPPEQEALDEFEAQTPVASADTGSFSPEAEPTETSEAQSGIEVLEVPGGTGPQLLSREEAMAMFVKVQLGTEALKVPARTGPQLLSREKAMAMFVKMESAVAKSRLPG